MIHVVYVTYLLLTNSLMIVLHKTLTTRLRSQGTSVVEVFFTCEPDQHISRTKEIHRKVL